MNYRQSSSNPLDQQHHWWHRLHLSSQKFAVVLTLAAFVTGFGYVLLTNTTAAEGLAIQKLQDDIVAMQAENEKLQLKAADLQSLSVADEASASLDLQPVQAFQVLAPTDGPVAIGQ